MLSAADLGIDDRATQLLESLPEASQQAILQKLSDGVDEGKIRNVSAYVASACMKPDALGIDERAAELLKQLPKQRQKEVLDKLKNTEGVKNPSAWVAKACLQEGSASSQAFPQQWQPVFVKGGGYGPVLPWSGHPQPLYGKGGGYGVPHFGGYGGYAAPNLSGPPRGGDSRLDDSANQLLQSLPVKVRKEIMAKLKQETGIRNPSAWVAKAALQAGATPQTRSQDDVPDLHFGVELELDAQAQDLLSTLPPREQEIILEKLQNETGVRNPSAWVAKAALKAGASTSRERGVPALAGGPALSGMHLQSLGLDAQAQQLLQTLGPDEQDDIMAKLQEMQAAGQVRNPSGWVVKAALNAGAVSQGSPGPGDRKGGKGGKGGGKGGKRFSPY